MPHLDALFENNRNWSRRMREADPEFFDRLNQLDVTISKVFLVKGTRFEPEMAVFNALNGTAVSAVRSLNFGTASYEQPSTILQGRFVRLGIKMKW